MLPLRINKDKMLSILGSTFIYHDWYNDHSFDVVHTGLAIDGFSSITLLYMIREVWN